MSIVRVTVELQGQNPADSIEVTGELHVTAQRDGEATVRQCAAEAVERVIAAAKVKSEDE